MTDPAEIARGLTKAQREALSTAEVREPHPSMPTYWAITMPCRGMGGAEAEELQSLGLVVLPFRRGGRSGPSVYSGEITPLGLAVRQHIKEVDDAA